MIIFKNKKKIVIWSISIVLTLSLLVGGFTVYVSDYYRADRAAIDAFLGDDPIIETILFDGAVAYGNPDALYGFIFYPGGKVEHTAYEPLMRRLAADGVLCILLEMPFHLAVLDMNAADGICAYYPNVEHWYIGGHSLGGSMAAYYIEDHIEDFEGLILLGSYSSKDLSGSSLRVLSVYGSEDRVLNHEKYEQYKKNLPATFTEICINGGCHAYFGMYGEQSGDGTPTITSEEQIQKTSESILSFMKPGEY